MRISLKRDVLLKPLSVAAGVVERRQSLPILANVLVKQDGNRLTLVGTDMEVEVITHVTTEQSATGEITLPARKLLDICRALPADAVVDITLDKDKAVIKSGRSRFRLLTLPATDFPSLDAANWDESLQFSQRDLKRLLERTAFCMAQQDVRYYLNGLLLDLQGKRVRAVATDGHRMALCEQDAANGAKSDRQVIVPRKGVMEMLRFLTDSEDPAEIQLSNNHLRLKIKDLTFTTKLIDGRFPDYNKVIPQQLPNKLLIKKDIFKDVLTRAAILSNEKYRGVRFTMSSGNLKLTAHNPEQEEAQEEVPVQYAGDEFEIGFNVSYVLDAVNAIDSADVEMSLNDPNSSCTLSAPSTTQIRYIIMPMRL
jgi:DNA polymerase-3 subunit beta